MLVHPVGTQGSRCISCNRTLVVERHPAYEEANIPPDDIDHEVRADWQPWDFSNWLFHYGASYHNQQVRLGFFYKKVVEELSLEEAQPSNETKVGTIGRTTYRKNKWDKVLVATTPHYLKVYSKQENIFSPSDKKYKVNRCLLDIVEGKSANVIVKLAHDISLLFGPTCSIRTSRKEELRYLLCISLPTSEGKTLLLQAFTEIYLAWWHDIVQVSLAKLKAVRNGTPMPISNLIRDGVSVRAKQIVEQHEPPMVVASPSEESLLVTPINTLPTAQRESPRQTTRQTQKELNRKLETPSGSDDPLTPPNNSELPSKATHVPNILPSCTTHHRKEDLFQIQVLQTLDTLVARMQLMTTQQANLENALYANTQICHSILAHLENSQISATLRHDSPTYAQGHESLLRADSVIFQKPNDDASTYFYATTMEPLVEPAYAENTLEVLEPHPAPLDALKLPDYSVKSKLQSN